MDASNWIDFNSPDNYAALSENLNFLEDHQSPSGDSKAESRSHDNTTQTANTASNTTNNTVDEKDVHLNRSYLMDLQKWTEFNFDPQNSSESPATTTNSKLQVSDQLHGKKYVPATPQLLEVNNCYNINPPSYEKVPDPSFAVESSKFFTPLISPAMTPLQSMILESAEQHHNSIHANSTLLSDINQEFFTPLTSPAINPMNQNIHLPGPFDPQSQQLQRSSRSKLYTNLTNNVPSKRMSGSKASSSGRISKGKASNNSSPVIKSKASPLVRSSVPPNYTSRKNSINFVSDNASNNHIDIDKINFQDLENFSLPENLQNNQTEFLQQQMYDAQIYSSVNNSQTSLHSTNIDRSNDLLGPSLYSNEVTNENDFDPSSKPVTPATLMNLKFRQGDHSLHHSQYKNSSKPGPEKLKKSKNGAVKEITFQTKPPTSSQSTTNPNKPSKSTSNSNPSSNTKFSSFKTYKTKSNSHGKNIMNSVIAHQTLFKLNLNQLSSRYASSSSSSNVKINSPLITGEKDFDPNDPNCTQKKSSHREAEKGRRDRMNIAIHDLALLIPDELTNTVVVPSKATTVELAGKYIQSLLKEIEHLKKGTNKEEENEEQQENENEEDNGYKEENEDNEENAETEESN